METSQQVRACRRCAALHVACVEESVTACIKCRVDGTDCSLKCVGCIVGHKACVVEGEPSKGCTLCNRMGKECVPGPTEREAIRVLRESRMGTRPRNSLGGQTRAVSDSGVSLGEVRGANASEQSSLPVSDFKEEENNNTQESKMAAPKSSMLPPPLPSKNGSQTTPAKNQRQKKVKESNKNDATPTTPSRARTSQPAEKPTQRKGKKLPEKNGAMAPPPNVPVPRSAQGPTQTKGMMRPVVEIPLGPSRAPYSQLPPRPMERLENQSGPSSASGQYNKSVSQGPYGMLSILLSRALL